MKIAHIAPPWLALPPVNYGGTEIVVYNLVEEQVAQGHDVTLFAPGDARTSARLISFFPRSLIATGVPWQGHNALGESMSLIEWPFVLMSSAISRCVLWPRSTPECTRRS